MDALSQLDLLDRRIMYELDLDARAPASSLARKLRRSKETVNFRLNRLCEQGFLKGFYTVFNTSKLGFYYYKFYIKFKNITPKKEAELFEYVKRQPRIAYLASTEGHYDAMILVMVRTPKDVVAFWHPFMKKFGQFVQSNESTMFLTTRRFNNRFVHSGTERRDWHYPLEVGAYSLDQVERKIVQALSDNARMPLSEIAARAGVDRTVAAYRLKKLEQDGIILAFVTSPNFEKMGLEFFQINISVRNPDKMRAMLDFFDNTNKCLFALEMVGRFDLAVELHLQNAEELKKVVDVFRENFSFDYNDYEVSTITKEYKVVYCPFHW